VTGPSWVSVATGLCARENSAEFAVRTALAWF